MLLIICKVYEVRNIFKAFYHAWWVMDRRVANSILILQQKYLQKKIEFVISLSKIRLFFYWIPKCFPTNNWMCKYLNLVVHKKPDSSLCTENAIKTIFQKSSFASWWKIRAPHSRNTILGGPAISSSTDGECVSWQSHGKIK